jgi:hypothetical protein
VVAVTGAPSGERLIRRAARIAGRARATCSACTSAPTTAWPRPDRTARPPAHAARRPRRRLPRGGGHRRRRRAGPLRPGRAGHPARARAPPTAAGGRALAGLGHQPGGAGSGEFDVHVISRTTEDDEDRAPTSAPAGARCAPRSARAGPRRLAVRPLSASRSSRSSWCLLRDELRPPGRAHGLRAARGGRRRRRRGRAGPRQRRRQRARWSTGTSRRRSTRSPSPRPRTPQPCSAFVLVAVVISLLVSRIAERRAAATPSRPEAEALARVAAGLALDADPLPSHARPGPHHVPARRRRALHRHARPGLAPRRGGRGRPCRPTPPAPR